jgi:sugar/nucleoside kinase (ribokinase family)
MTYFQNILMTLLFLAPPLASGEYQVLGLGSPCIDYIIPVQEEDLIHLNLKKGGQLEIEKQALVELIDLFQEKMVFTGNCTANTIKGLASLGIPCALTGHIGNDPLGDRIKKDFTQLKVATLFSEASATAQIACLITPDGERSFYAFIQPEREISESALKKEYFEGVELVHMEGFRLYNETYMEKSMQLAQEAGAKISLDLANAALVETFRERILALLTDTDIVFANEDEAYALTHLPPKQAAIFLKNFCSIAVVKVGNQGCWVAFDRTLFHAPAVATTVVDTTGAGDLFASAFLYGYLHNYSPRTCARFGNLAGGAAVELYGAELPLTKWKEIRLAISNCG